jgi:hypothetical protein
MPELKLIFMLVSSGAMFHLQSTMFQSAPGMDEVMKRTRTRPRLRGGHGAVHGQERSVVRAQEEHGQHDGIHVRGAGNRAAVAGQRPT